MLKAIRDYDNGMVYFSSKLPKECCLQRRIVHYIHNEEQLYKWKRFTGSGYQSHDSLWSFAGSLAVLVREELPNGRNQRRMRQRWDGLTLMELLGYCLPPDRRSYGDQPSSTRRPRHSPK